MTHAPYFKSCEEIQSLYVADKLILKSLFTDYQPLQWAVNCCRQIMESMRNGSVFHNGFMNWNGFTKNLRLNLFNIDQILLLLSWTTRGFSRFSSHFYENDMSFHLIKKKILFYALTKWDILKKSSLELHILNKCCQNCDLGEILNWVNFPFKTWMWDFNIHLFSNVC